MAPIDEVLRDGAMTTPTDVAELIEQLRKGPHIQHYGPWQTEEDFNAAVQVAREDNKTMNSAADKLAYYEHMAGEDAKHIENLTAENAALLERIDGIEPVLTARIEELETENIVLHREVYVCKARIEELERALEPFAKMVDIHHHSGVSGVAYVRVFDLHQACAALNASPVEPKP